MSSMLAIEACEKYAYSILSDFDPDPLRSLHPSEFELYRTMTVSRASSFVRGRYALKSLLNCNDMRDFSILPDGSGRPQLTDSDVYCSISHTNEYAVAVVCKRFVGIDIERVGRRHPALMRSIASEDELKAAKLNNADVSFVFAAKEAVTKSEGAVHPLSAYRISAPNRMVRGTQVWDFFASELNGHVLTIATPV